MVTLAGLHIFMSKSELILKYLKVVIQCFVSGVLFLIHQVQSSTKGDKFALYPRDKLYNVISEFLSPFALFT